MVGGGDPATVVQYGGTKSANSPPLDLYYYVNGDVSVRFLGASLGDGVMVDSHHHDVENDRSIENFHCYGNTHDMQ